MIINTRQGIERRERFQTIPDLSNSDGNQDEKNIAFGFGGQKK